MTVIALTCLGLLTTLQAIVGARMGAELLRLEERVDALERTRQGPRRAGYELDANGWRRGR